MKKILLALSLVACAAVAFAAGEPGTGVLGSVHDMRTATGSGPGSDGTNDRVCAFCHTPHHAYQGSDPNEYYPLWSRTLDVQNFTPYASSTINAIDWASDIAIGPTRLCMSCHDGTIAVDQHYGSIATGSSKFLGENNVGLDGVWMGGAGIGAGAAGLSNDHPVGFNYDTIATGPSTPGTNPTVGQVQGAQPQEDVWIRAAADDLTYSNNTWGIKVADRLYTDPADGARYMTCATCHDVHNKKNMDTTAQSANYLVLAPQKDSALCLTCHIK
jgi:cytochrome c553